LTGYIPPTFFAGISTSTTIDDQMTNVFNNSGLDTECPDGMTQYMTGFEDFFTGKVSCEMACTDGIMYNGECRAYCPVMRTLHVGDVEYPIFADRTGVSPVFNLQNGNTTCYLYLEPGRESGSLTTEYDSTVYHVFKPEEDE
jgi:hypothetical protein